MLSRRVAILGGTAVALGAAILWLAPAREPSSGRVRVVQRLTNPQGGSPFDPVGLAASAPQRWTAVEIEQRWTHQAAGSGRIYRSPAIDSSRGGLFAIVATLPEASERSALIFWSHGPTLSGEDFLRNRRELRTTAGRTLVLRADTLQLDDRPIQHVFIHVPDATALGSALEALSILNGSDLTSPGPTGPLRLTKGGEVRDVVLAPAGHRVSYEVDTPASFVSFAVHLSDGAAATVRAWQQTASTEAMIASVHLTGIGWHDLVAPLVHADRSVLTFEALPGPSPGNVTWSTPVLLAADTEPERPNIILYVVDALRADALGVYGAADGRSPTIDALGREALLFTRAYAAASWTKPSVTTLLTSLYPMTHGVGARFLSDPLPETAFTVQEALAARGYVTAQFSANPFAGPLSNLDKGFDVAVTPPGLRAAAPIDADAPIRAADIHDRALAWITRHKDARFFAYIQAIDTHPPFSVRGETARAGYDASLASVDDAIGRFREQLAALGVRHNTLFIITADHGEAFGEHGHNGHGQSVYEEEIRVPLLFHWPERIAAMRVDESVHHVDLVPTVLAMAGIPAESQFDGRSLWALSGAPRQPSPVVVTRFVYPEDVDGPVRDQTESHAIIDYPWKLITFGSGGGSVRAELYRLDLDPGERRDLARSEGARVKTLQEALRRFIADQAERRRRFDLDHARAGMPPSTPPTRDLLDQLRSLGYVR